MIKVIQKINIIKFMFAFFAALFTISALAQPPVYAAGIAAEAPATTPRRNQASGISLSDAVVTAEKMYYCGELYIFIDSMIKINYEMASIAENLKYSIQRGSFTRNRTSLNTMVAKYNKISEKYNNWVDVRGDLEYYIDIIGARGIFSKSQLQIAFKRTLDVIDSAKSMLDDAQEYYEDQTPALRRSLTSSADLLTISAAGAVNVIAPYAQAAMSAYRGLFDQFAQQAGIDVEYKTWRNPENAE